MKIKLSDYIANFLVENGITDMFTVTGGGSMHLNDSFGHKNGLHCTYNHNEQASAMAAEAYARINNKIAGVCVTMGPGASNAITGVLCGYMDSIPMLIFSGQSRYATCVRSTGLSLRTMGTQEFDITRAVECMTKYAVMVTDANMIKYHLEKALFLAKNGRPAPCWLDIPLDIQAKIIDTDDLADYNPQEDIQQIKDTVDDGVIDAIIDRLKNAQRPVIMTGSGIRLSGAHMEFLQLAKTLNIPVVNGMSSIDAIEYDSPVYVGKSGGTGDRAGNFAVQNSDVLFSLGNRLSYMQIGFNEKTWARAAFKIANDIDSEELKKPYLNIDLPVVCDAKVLINKLNSRLKELNVKKLFNGRQWLDKCAYWKEHYQVVNESHYKNIDNRTNIYAFYNELYKALKENDVLVASVGTSRVVGSQTAKIKKGQRFITNPNTASMGYCLPAAIGVCTACNGKSIACVTGDGSLQMNIQELQTIVTNKLPVKLFVINNNGYHSIRQTQTAYFSQHTLVGVGTDSSDLGFPNLERLSKAYGIAYTSVCKSENLFDTISSVLNSEGTVLCEVFVTTKQKTEPKASSKKLEDGSMVSAPLEDLAPFLPREELEENMFIPLV